MHIRGLLWGFLLVPWVAAQDGFFDSVKDGKLILDFRYRYGWIDDASFDKDSHASTLNTRLGWQTADYRGLTFLLEFEDVSVIGNELYNDGINGLNRPREADPADTEINRMQIGYALSKNQRIVVGRQAFDLDNRRILGVGGWRQNGRSIDMLRYQHDALGPFKFTGLWLENVNQAGGPDHPNPLAADTRIKGQVLHALNEPLPGMQLSLFGYFFDFTDLPEQSHRNLGFYARGQWPPDADQAWTYEASYIRQDDHADGAAVIDVDYAEATLGYQWGGFHVRANWERLAGNGNYAFQTPLALRHGPNGWVDRFLNTPADGLVDQNLGMTYNRGAWRAEFYYHVFESDVDDRAYGDEWNLRLRRDWTRRYSTVLDIADYSAEDFASDMRKIWLYFNFSW